MEITHLSFRLLALSLTIFLSAYFVVFQRNRNGALLALLSFCFCCYLSQPLVYGLDGAIPMLEAVSIFATLIPAVLWVVANKLLNDVMVIPRWLIVATVFYMSIWYMNDVSELSLGNADLDAVFLDLLPELVKLGLVVHVVYMALEGRKNDLVTQRLQLRVPIALGSGALCALVIIVELWAAGEMPMLVEVIASVFLFLVALGACLSLFRLREDLPLQVAEPAANPVSSQIDNQEDDGETVSAILSLMTEQRFYAQHGATLADMAEQIQLPAYRLRKLINQRLGHRNFNQFLNHYRIEEAAQRIQQDRNVPILTIALDVGFKSMSSFNQAFRIAHGTNPSSFRDLAPSP